MLVENPLKHQIQIVPKLPSEWKLASDQSKPFAKFINIKSVHLENAGTKKEVKSEASVLLEGLQMSSNDIKAIDSWEQLKINVSFSF